MNFVKINLRHLSLVQQLKETEQRLETNETIREEVLTKCTNIYTL